MRRSGDARTRPHADVVSALFGVVGLDGRPWAASDLDGVAKALAPHGPDGGGRWHGTAGSCGVAMGAALRHRTPEDAHDRQPAESADGSLILAADIRIDNRDTLAAALGHPAGDAVTDSALLLAGYERWGEGVLDHMVGEFAFALVDRRRGGVLLARDHFGDRPLAVHEGAGFVAFASNPLALTAFDGVGRDLDLESVAQVLALIPQTERTLVRRVRWVPAATSMWIDPSGVRRRTWWDPDPHDVDDGAGPAEHAERLRTAFDAAVAARLRSTGPVAVCTSGGLDSASVAATAAMMVAPAPLLTYTSAPPPGWSAVAPRPGWDADETSLVQDLARLHPNIRPSFFRIEPGRLFDDHEPFWELGAGPFRNPFNWPWWSGIRFRARADGAASVLTGARGNLAFSADGPGWLAALARSGRHREAWHEAGARARATESRRSRVLAQAALPLVPFWFERHLRTAARRPLPDAGRWLEQTALRPALRSGLEIERALPMLDVARRVDRRAVALALLKATSTGAADAAALAVLSGVDIRDPTADRRVIEAALRQPDPVRRRNGVQRAVVREAMGDRLPPSLGRRTRRGEQAPEWLDLLTAERRVVEAEVEAMHDHAASRALIDTERLRGLLQDWPAPAARMQPQVLRDYQLALPRAIVVSRYVRWFERSGASAP